MDRAQVHGRIHHHGVRQASAQPLFEIRDGHAQVTPVLGNAVARVGNLHAHLDQVHFPGGVLTRQDLSGRLHVLQQLEAPAVDPFQVAHSEQLVVRVGDRVDHSDAVFQVAKLRFLQIGLGVLDVVFQRVGLEKRLLESHEVPVVVVYLGAAILLPVAVSLVVE